VWLSFGSLGLINNNRMHEDELENKGQLWLMIKLSGMFHSDLESKIEGELIELVEGQGLGQFDGHSSGAGQFDLNFFEVADFEKVKSLITRHLQTNYPKVEFVASDDYETTFDQLPL
jgi:hypothetical protein